MSKNNLKSPFIKEKHTVKLYKAGKQWAIMGMTVATLAGISLATGTTAKAMETTTNDATPATSQNLQHTGTDESQPATDPATSTETKTVPASANNAETPANVATSNTGNTGASSNNTSGQTINARTDTASNAPTGSTTAEPQATPATNATVNPVAAPAPEPEAPTAETNPIVATTDQSGTASTDPTKTGNSSPVKIEGQQIAEHFVAGGNGGPTTPQINGNTANLTIPTDPDYVQNAAVIAKDAVDFNSDFSLNATVNVNWDPSMGSWLGGDGMAVAFQPISTNDALTKGATGGGMGLVQTDDQAQPIAGTISYIISTNALGQSPLTVDGAPNTNSHHWVIYQSGSASSQATGGVYDTGVAVPSATQTTGNLTYTFDVKYEADTKQLVTNILDTNGNSVKTFTQTIKPEQMGKNYVLGVTASTAASKAAYNVTINSYAYVPADAKLNITSNQPSVGQSGINGTPGQVIAFYQSGTAAPTTDTNNNPVSVAYEVPTVQGYTLASPQFVTLTAGGENNVNLIYTGNPVTTTVTIPSNQGDQTVTNVTGHVGDTINVTVPSLTGYTADKDAVAATINPNGTITVNTPKTQTGDAGYVTYTGDPVTATVTIPSNKGNQTVTNVSGKVGDTVQVSVPTINGYTADKASVAATVNTDGSIVVNVPKAQTGDAGYVTYTGDPVTATVTIPSNQGNQTVAGVTGKVGDTVNVSVPTINGYTADKSTVAATVNADNTITVNDPKASSGDAGYVTYTVISSQPDNNQPNNQPGGSTGTNPSNPTTPATTTDANDDTVTPVTTNDSNDGSTTLTDTTDSTNGTKPSAITTGSSNATAIPEAETQSTNQGSSQSQNSSQSTTEQHSAVVPLSTTNQPQMTKSSNSIATPGQSRMTQKETVQNNSGQLPQTNEQSDQAKATGLLGLIMISLLSLFGLRRKQTDDK